MNPTQHVADSVIWREKGLHRQGRTDWLVLSTWGVLIVGGCAMSGWAIGWAVAWVKTK